MQCFNGIDALKLHESGKPDLIVLDLMLPGLDGLEVARRIRTSSGTPIIMLTSRDSEADKLLGLEIGADDYMTKPFSVRELCARIRAVLRRAVAVSDAAEASSLIKLNEIEIDSSKRRVTKGGKEVTLTSAQFELLHLLFQSPGRFSLAAN